MRRARPRPATRVVNVSPDTPVTVLPIGSTDAYDVSFTKHGHALRRLLQVGLRNLQYLPLYCVPSAHHPVAPSEAERLRFGSPLSFVGSRYDYRERFVRELADYPLRIWGPGWDR